MLQQEGVWNDFSPALRKKLEDKIASFGKLVRFKFNISNIDPDPEKRAVGAVVYPFMYTLKPVTFSIDDTDEKREGKQRYKKVGMVSKTDFIDGRTIPTEYKRVKIHAKDKGIKKYDLESTEDIEEVMYLLVHPKLIDGMFADKDKSGMVLLIDEKAASAVSRTERSAKVQALNIAQGMSDEDVVNFCDAMQWDSTDDIGVLRDKVEALAETQPIYFNDLADGKNIEYQAVVKQALDRNIISFDPAEYKFFFKGNNQPITVLSPVGNKNHVEKMAEWFMIGGKAAEESYKKIKALTSSKKEVTV